MRSAQWFVSVCLCCALTLAIAHHAGASLTLATGLGTTHAGNLVSNGSFETGGAAQRNREHGLLGQRHVADPLLRSARLDELRRLHVVRAVGQRRHGAAIDPRERWLARRRRGLVFRQRRTALVDQPPTFNPDGTVSFPAAPNFSITYSPVPVVLTQTINTPASPASGYDFSFWISGEGAVAGQHFTERGIFGLQVTNVLPGDPIQWLAVPNGNSNSFGVSHLYEYTFTPLNPLAPVTVNFINWGHFDLSAYGMSNFTTELILDDVIINPVPEPGSCTLLALGGGSLCFALRRRGRSRKSPRPLA